MIARRLAVSSAASAEISEAAEQVARYFADAFPHHVADEDALAASLAGRDAKTDRTLAIMSNDHVTQAQTVAQLVSKCRELATHPSQFVALAESLLMLVDDLETALSPHLELEERELFPLIQRLSHAEQDTFQRAARRRRGIA